MHKIIPGNRRKFVVWDYLSCVRPLKIVLKSVWKISAPLAYGKGLEDKSTSPHG